MSKSPSSPPATVAQQLAEWSHRFVPSEDDLALANRSLIDTVAVACAATSEPLVKRTATMGRAGRWAVAAHVLDFDDLHLPSTAHISTVVVPAVLACGGDARAYLVGAGVMARLGAALGWGHYSSGWHATCTSGAPAAAAAAAAALGLDVTQTAHAIALAIPAAGGVQRAFGTDSKALQVGFAVDGGVRAAMLAGEGAMADPSAVDAWMRLVGAGSMKVELDGPAVPDGLAIKLHPCCYAMQRPIAAIREFAADVDHAEVSRVSISTPSCSVQPLIHRRPTTGLQGKFSLEYAIATALLDGFPGLDSFTDEAVRRPAAQRLIHCVEVETTPGGEGMLAGSVEIKLELTGGRIVVAKSSVPPGAPTRAPSDADIAKKVASCDPSLVAMLPSMSWADAAAVMHDRFGVRASEAFADLKTP